MPITSPMPTLLDRTVCEWIRAVSATIMSGCLVTAMIGGFKVYGEFEVLARDVKEIAKKVDEGILPKAAIRIGRMEEQMKNMRRDLERLEKGAIGKD